MTKFIQSRFNFIYYLLAILLVLILSGFIFVDNNPFGYINPFILLSMVGSILAIGGVLLKLLVRFRCDKIKHHFILFTYFAVVLLMLVLIGGQLEVIPSWDFGSVSSVAIDFAEDGSFQNLDYFYMHPNNHFIIFVLSAIFRISALIGFNDFVQIGMFVNGICIVSAICITYLCVKKMFDENIADFSLILLFFMSPLFLYLPIYYSDTLSLPFGILILYSFLHIDLGKCVLKGSNIKAMLVMTVASFLGYGLKASALIILIAIMLYWIVYNYKLSFKAILVFISSFAILYGGLQGVYHFISYDEGRLENERFSSTHYLMVGTSKVTNADGFTYYGFYNDEDFYFTLSLPQVSRNQYTTEKAIARVSERGLFGNLDFYYNKLTQTWCDGTYYAPEKLTRMPVDDSSLFGEVFRKEGDLFNIYFYFAQAYQFVLISLILASVVYVIKKQQTQKYFVIYTSVFGLILFLLLWETRSRYIVNLIPILIIAALPIVQYFRNQFGRKENEKNKQYEID